MERIDKILSHHGFGSRKDVKKLLRDERVTVNGKFVYDSGFQLDIENDVVCVDDEEIRLQHDVYIMMNKCQDVVCANKDGEHQTVFDLLDESLKHKFLGGDLHCMGRLDIDTEGLLILTTDGKLTHKLLSPKTHAPKTYAVGLRDSLTEEEKQNYTEKFSKGFWVDREQNEAGFDAQPAEIQFTMSNEENNKSAARMRQKANETANRESESSRQDVVIDCLLTIYEGKFHQVKRMFAQLGNEVVYLKRVKMGQLELDPAIPLGGYRELTKEEIELLSK
ncbi:MAG: pseudouridine synthase [Treponema sp.]|uniref:pseudouridine synthase n=1 Tax=Treponema sp. TaxID=166 RepID=UPI002A91483B|nr:pseudouridine synthase [Treponema sp.]MDY6397079.1 pseudouridine synthase [Treponema sp.]